MNRHVIQRLAVVLLLGLFAMAAPAYAAPEDSDAPASDSSDEQGAGESDGESAASEGEPSGSASATTTEAPAPYCEQQPTPAPLAEDAPWTVPMYSAADRLAPYSTGDGVVVAVIDSGVQSSHPQLTGRVASGFDTVRGLAGADDDCAGHGTGMAGIVAGQAMENVGFVGLAPDATILPVRITEQAVKGKANPSEMPVSRLAAGIDWAVANGADVIVPGVSFYGTDDPTLNASVAAAIEAGVVVIAGAGDQQPDDEGAYLPVPADLVPYPAMYDGVIGVGAIGSERQRDPKSQIGDFVDLVAPGSNLLVPSIGGHTTDSGTAYAAAYVGAAAALILGAQPSVIPSSLSGPELVQAVSDRIIGTASPAAGEGVPMGYGEGVLDPYRALTDMMNASGPVPPTSYVPPPPDPIAEAQAEQDATNASRGSIVTWSAFGLLMLIGAGTAIWTRGRNRRWTPATARTNEESLPEAEPEFVSGEKLFAPKELD